VALPIDAAYELLGFLLRPWVDVAQQAIERERTGPDQVGRIIDGLRRHTIHLDHRSSAAGALNPRNENTVRASGFTGNVGRSLAS
jgi:hypothetical protein